VVEALQLMDRGGMQHPAQDARATYEGVLRQKDILEFVAEAFRRKS